MMRHLLIRKAIVHPDLAQFHIHYQPLVDLFTGRIVGFESLLRWQHPELGMVPPDVFISLAERAGASGSSVTMCSRPPRPTSVGSTGAIRTPASESGSTSRRCS